MDNHYGNLLVKDGKLLPYLVLSSILMNAFDSQVIVRVENFQQLDRDCSMTDGADFDAYEILGFFSRTFLMERVRITDDEEVIPLFMETAAFTTDEAMRAYFLFSKIQVDPFRRVVAYYEYKGFYHR